MKIIFNLITCMFHFLFGLVGLVFGRSERPPPNVKKPCKKLQSDINFKYLPLELPSYFRLLKLKPGKDKDPLVGNLKHFNLVSSVHRKHNNPFLDILEHFDLPSSVYPHVPSYKAISYTWGSQKVEYTVKCDNRSLGITASLQHALCQVRNPTASIYVWADAICINQSDIFERKRQVALMQRIYANAETVFICLGEANDYTPQELNIFKAAFRWSSTPMFNRANQRLQRRRNRGSPLSIASSILDTKLNKGLDSGLKSRAVPSKNQQFDTLSPLAWKLLGKFFDNPWFSRIWVVQEVAENENVQVLFKKLNIPWLNVVFTAQNILKDVHYRARVLAFSETNGIHNVLFMNNNIPVAQEDPIPCLLQSTRDFKASDARDKVYAVLHRPLPTPRKAYSILDSQDQLVFQFSLQCIALLSICSIALNKSSTYIHFWSIISAVLILIQQLQLLNTARLLIVSFYQRLTHFSLKVERVLYIYLCKYLKTYFSITDTLCNMLSIYADYSITAPALYRMVAKRVILRSQSLNILSYVTHGASIDINYPSWVPRWDVETGGVAILHSLPNQQYCTAAGMKHTLSDQSQHADHVKAEGIRFSVVSSVSDVIAPMQLSQLNVNQLSIRDVQATALDVEQFGDKYPTGESMRRAYIATLTAGRLGQINEDSEYSDEKGLQWLIATALRSSYKRRQFMTDNGYIGIGPAAMQSGDRVFVLFGGSLPYILRDTDTQGLYRVVGESYVHGIMYGEVIQQWREDKYEKCQLTLC